ncbi:MAG: hypothetical protein KME11_12525 [Timaviella obliquedivisa GSE-PSE-MK23-08B]|jgi:hypothetical protein|nr:hypothetical protein [Timaviella obliquedivisa GSE-PSE-MK23-08B]
MAINTDKLNATANGSTAGKGFTPKAKGDRPNQPTEATEQKGIVTADTHGTARERVIETANAGSDLVQSLVSAAQTQARQQAEAIAAYPQLVDQLTVMYLEESGVTEPGKPTETHCFSGAIEGMGDFRVLLEASGAKSKQIAAARNQRQLSAAS